MNCNEFKAMIPLFIEGGLSSEELDIFNAHVSSCDDCEEELLEEYIFKKSMDELPETSPVFNNMVKDISKLIAQGFRGKDLIKGSEKVFSDYSEKFDGELAEDDKQMIAEIIVLDAKAYEKEGKLEEAIKCLEEALELRPGDEDVESELMRLTGARIFRVIMDGVLKLIYFKGQKIIFDLVDIKETIIEYGKKRLGIIRAKEAMGFSDNYVDGIIHEGDDFILEVKRGVYEDRLIIRPKD